MSQNTPTLLSGVTSLVAARLADVWTSTVGVVHEYDATTRRASVKCAVKRSYTDPETGDTISESLPIINGVPVIMPGSGGVRVKFPIGVGDSVLVIFTSQSLDRWLVRGGIDVDPGDPRRHDFNDAIAIPGVSDFAHVADGAPMIEFTADAKIHAGGSSALALSSELAALRNAISGATTGDAIPGVVAALPSFAGTQTLKGG